MELELEAAGGGGSCTPVSLTADSPSAALGRGDLGAADRTVSRRHVSLRLLGGGGGDEPPRVTFEVVGRNPVVVRTGTAGGGGRSRVYRRGEAGDLRDGDALALSLRAPPSPSSFWVVRRRSKDGEVEAEVMDAVARRERRTRERRAAEEAAMEVTADEEEAAAADAVSGGDFDAEAGDLELDLANIDPVREFGFLSMGHEFDNYLKGRIRPPKVWNWFLEEVQRGSVDEDDMVSKRGGKLKGRGTNKKNEGQREDENWIGESEDEKDTLSRGPSVKRSKYVTRSKEPKKPRKEKSEIEGDNKNPVNKVDEEDEEDEEDETLGGFIVNEEDEPMEELSEEEEDEFDDDDDDE